MYGILKVGDRETDVHTKCFVLHDGVRYMHLTLINDTQTLVFDSSTDKTVVHT